MYKRFFLIFVTFLAYVLKPFLNFHFNVFYTYVVITTMSFEKQKKTKPKNMSPLKQKAQQQ